LVGAFQGQSVSISSDGNTAIVGGYNDNNGVGAAWIFTRTGVVWTQQGNKLVGTGAVNSPNPAQQGYSVSLSSDGNTAIVGGNDDNGVKGAVWVYIRNAGVWTQQGSKLVGTGATGSAQQGWAVSVSGDGNTIMEGGFGDNSGAGASWVFTRSGVVWTQQGTKLVGTGAVGNADQGNACSLSYSGDTAIVGGQGDNSTAGAAWIFTRSTGVWTQHGNKLVGTGATGAAQQGWYVAISSDGSTAIVGGNQDNSGAGAAWVYSSLATGIAEVNKGQEEIIVYPNPANTILNIHFSNSSLLPFNSLFLITDILGNEVYSETLAGIDNSIDVSKWSNGIYFYQLSNNKETVRGKFIKE
jgi:hypothetical protein